MTTSYDEFLELLHKYINLVRELGNDSGSNLPHLPGASTDFNANTIPPSPSTWNSTTELNDTASSVPQAAANIEQNKSNALSRYNLRDRKPKGG